MNKLSASELTATSSQVRRDAVIANLRIEHQTFPVGVVDRRTDRKLGTPIRVENQLEHQDRRPHSSAVKFETE